MPQIGFRLLADAVLIAHAAFVCFVVAGLAYVVVGAWRGWHGARAPLFRVLHLAAIGIVVAQAWLGVRCPLTGLEMWLRTRAGDATYPGGFVAHWIENALYYHAPGWVFGLIYTVFGALVVATWWWVPPRRNGCAPSRSRRGRRA